MFVSNVNYAVIGYSALDGSSYPQPAEDQDKPVASSSSAHTTGQQPTAVARTNKWEGVISLVDELERLIGLLSQRFKPDIDATPVDKRPTHPDRFIRGTPADAGAKPNDVFRDFYQHSEGNCVTISAIKAAMMKFGHNPHGIYRAIQTTDTGYHIVMRDSFKLDITHAELEQARKGADFLADRPNDVWVNAQFLYAVSAKRAQLENNDGTAEESFAAGMLSLNDGEYPGQALRRLGLKDHVAPATLQDFKDGAIGTLADSFHSMAVIDGMLDSYGAKAELRPSDWNGQLIIGLKLL